MRAREGGGHTPDVRVKGGGVEGKGRGVPGFEQEGGAPKVRAQGSG